MTLLYVLLGLALIILALSFTSFEINEKVEIVAPIEKVWSTIIDFESYSKWNSQLEYLGGQVKPNGILHLRLAAEGTKPYEFKPLVSQWEEHKRFAWLAKTGLPRIFDGEHFFELEPIDENTTLVTNREEYRGVLSLIMKNQPMMKAAPKGFIKMNRELKSHLEQLS
ncbi:SRPBCC domain-containing protein [Algoriphagus lacus]|uniref:SRPBCC domain-containing protein n=1 Tax=Algoriphagus lacus TaxID=2056311 RepID=A0A418PNJ6_9BACT|nr:SRPBCC domain-containing protein [Algoriphagus lacus]RIW13398.1 SRPBCC domain-containing protein [Algoriphagus lacus]